MKPPLVITGLPVRISHGLQTLLEQAISSALEDFPDEIPDSTSPAALTLNYRDPDYSATTGGYHPVEIRLERWDDGWHLRYVTDFAYIGQGWCAELAKELDFDFSMEEYTHSLMGEMSLAEAHEWFELWQLNFCCYVQMDVFTLTVTPD
ncbi:DUF2787 family protein [Aeromonas sanarellii]|uniref:DUF2787 family protein n=1 Tax=Aeromonas sanarellii TaxID=633415 RepID=UPI0038D1B09E